MALCLAESLVEKNSFDPRDQMERYLRWWKEGHLSHSGNCFDIGNTTRKALSQFEITQDPFSGSSDSFAAGNGSIMRLAPVPMFYSREPELAIMKSAESSRTTHGANEAIDACKYLGAIIAGALNGATKDELLSEHYCPIDDYWKNNPLVPKIDDIAMGSFKRKDPPDIRGTGYVVQSLEAALWAFNKGNTFEEGCLLAVNLGDDADTTGAIYGQIAGAYFGEQDIPQKWLTNLAMRPIILDLAHRLFDSSISRP
jgi:ADP-ribosylglycohydrolase